MKLFETNDTEWNLLSKFAMGKNDKETMSSYRSGTAESSQALSNRNANWILM